MNKKLYIHSKDISLEELQEEFGSRLMDITAIPHEDDVWNHFILRIGDRIFINIVHINDEKLQTKDEVYR